MDNNIMNRKNELPSHDVVNERITLLEKRIEALEITINRNRDRFLEEDLKALGIQ